MNKYAVVCFIAAAINIPFVIQDLSRWWNWGVVACGLVGGIYILIDDNRINK